MSKTQETALEKMLFVLCVSAAVLLPETALSIPLDSTGTRIVDVFNGDLTRTLAITAIMASSIAAIDGKLPWDWMIRIDLGIVLVFGAASIADYVITDASG
jgi:type IV secretion system protein VirB2